MSNTSSQPTGPEITGGPGITPTPPPVPLPTLPPPPPAPTQQGQGEDPAKLLLFDPNRPPKTSVQVNVHLPELLPGHESFGFVFRLKFSADMQKKRDAFLNMAPKKQNESEESEVFEEVCDLLAQDPTGFAGWPQTTQNPADKLRDYVQSITNPVGLQIVKSILRTANLLYWGKVTPREFFPPTENTSA
jgi:hypothetical protein